MILGKILKIHNSFYAILDKLKKKVSYYVSAKYYTKNSIFINHNNLFLFPTKNKDTLTTSQQNWHEIYSSLNVFFNDCLYCPGGNCPKLEGGIVREGVSQVGVVDGGSFPINI